MAWLGWALKPANHGFELLPVDRFDEDIIEAVVLQSIQVFLESMGRVGDDFRRGRLSAGLELSAGFLAGKSGHADVE